MGTALVMHYEPQDTALKSKASLDPLKKQSAAYFVGL